jgi:flagellin
MSISSLGSSGADLGGLLRFDLNRQASAGTRDRLSTGFRVPGAAADGAAFAVAQGVRGEIGAGAAVNQQLGVARGVTGVALEAATRISDTLNQARTTLVRLADGNLSQSQREQLTADLNRLTGEAQNFLSNASFNGANLLEAGPDRQTIANPSGDSLTLSNQGLTAGGIQTALGGGGAITSDQAAALLQPGGGFEQLQQDVGLALVGVGGDTRRLQNQQAFNRAQSDAEELALGAVVDADIAQEASRQRRDQIREQISVSTLAASGRSRGLLLDLFA